MKKTKRTVPGISRVTFLCIAGLFGLFSFSHVSAQTDALVVQTILYQNDLPDNDISPYVVIRNGRVEELRLKGLNLTFLPQDIGNLTALVLLDLSDNSLESLPDEIGNCRDIQEIYLQNNNLSELPAGITSIPRTRSIQTTEYGCQITYDGTCIQYGPVLVTKTVGTEANLSSNRLCNESPGTTSWANAVDPDWSSTQNCGSFLLPPDYNTEDRTGIYGLRVHDGTGLHIYNSEGQIVKRFPANSMELKNHEFIWNGRNDHGSPVPAGIYFLRTNSGIFRQMIMTAP